MRPTVGILKYLSFSGSLPTSLFLYTRILSLSASETQLRDLDRGPMMRFCPMRLWASRFWPDEWLFSNRSFQPSAHYTRKLSTSIIAGIGIYRKIEK